MQTVQQRTPSHGRLENEPAFLFPKTCSEGRHEWAVPIANRTKNPGHDLGCPYCHNRKILSGFNDLATTHPEIAKEWNPYQNRNFKPTEVGAFSRKEVW